MNREERNAAFEKHLTCLITTLNDDICSVRFRWTDDKFHISQIKYRHKGATQYESINLLGYDLPKAVIEVMRRI